MAENSHIQWTDHTFNPWRGCTKISPGCEHCYAETLSLRCGKNGVGRYVRGGKRKRTGAANWRKPVKWNREAGRPLPIQESKVQCVICEDIEDEWIEAPCGPLCLTCAHEGFLEKERPRVFCASLADWLDDEVPIEWLANLLELIHATPNLDWQLLTKRPELWQQRLSETFQFAARNGDTNNERHMRFCDWVGAWSEAHVAPANVWIGTTVEDQKRAHERVPALLKIPAKVRFLSCEPLLSPVTLDAALEVWDYCAYCGTSFDYQEDAPDLCRRCGQAGCMSTGFGSDVRSLYDDADGRIEVRDGAPIDWVICGGESGAGARVMEEGWARSLRDQCQAAGVAFFMKQMGGRGDPRGKLEQLPEDLRVREFPKVATDKANL